MAKRTAGRAGGRPSKGPRDVIVTRVPTSDSAELRELAEARDWSFSETAAALIRIGLRHRDELPAETTPRGQEELPLHKAS
ncbi:hypothetical protein LWC35_31550 [Pseudonocardia kujensis]|uniref:hypothetical protein n=1 Tax=Pseudonocardia kujensis TaxID=1128675 RepID=UPI001E31EBC5|nr:hypothetical protein [Pseudonocardia kujensis]MCE0767402.1 hypothetical protein [Pseudonocardia kujensis]